MNDKDIKDKTMIALSGVFDPELNIPVTDLGIIYDLDITGDKALVTFTLTYPGCPLADQLDRDIRRAVHTVEGIKFVDTKLVWEPVWTPEMMSEAARFSMGYEI